MNRIAPLIRPLAGSRPPALRIRNGFTLVEVLVVIAIIGVLVALLLPAVQSARESARRVQCQNNLHQLGVATQNYHDRHGAYPPGVWQLSFAAAPRYRGVSLFVYLLPYMEQSSLYDRWDFDDPLANTAGGRTSPTAARLPNLICPSDMLQDNPVDAGSGRWYGMTSYGGNGGAQSYDPQFATNDGIFHVIGPGSQTDPSGGPVTMGGVIDGTTNTFLFGERRHFDPNHDTFAGGVAAPNGQFLNPMAKIGWWAPSGGRLAGGDVTLSAMAPINFMVPAPLTHGGSMVPPATNYNSYLYYNERRIGAFGSNHPLGANFALGDASVRFLRQSIPLTMLQRLAVRHDRLPAGLE